MQNSLKHRIFIRPESALSGYDICIEPAWQGVCNFNTERDTLEQARAYAKKISGWLKLEVIDQSNTLRLIAK